ncbi:soluble lytic murein transglycosylase [Legionella londiniensis]|uniref:Soluble lytic murein transglycosylase n=2 Tax=Legionella londiniensis TaxID=45068 RepID=A0A0W0VLT1_9GAMM|nr:soluble lytic murein transglycosylase [Legionella londiniensis]STX92785.1 soluble lytic murein transglycosylase [Legionella londiniensis]
MLAMSIKLQLFICGLCLSALVFASDANPYLEKFQTYLTLSQNLPDYPTPEFIDFISNDSPLANKLREKWLYQLGRKKDWSTFNQFYRNPASMELRCYALAAQYHLGKQKEALQSAEAIWLSGSSLPMECDEILNILLKSEQFNEQLITKRIVLALDKRNLSLARYLLKQYKKPRLEDIHLLNQIYRKPSSISLLQTGELHDDYYLYGLKRMVSIDMEQAVHYWNHIKTKQLLSESQQQSFLAHIALYKAIRNHADALQWFYKVKPAYYNDSLVDWQIRYALKHHKWREVIRIINLSPDKDNPSWQYWLARALHAQGKISQAQAIYEKLAKMRNYYGFLASLRLKKSFSFKNEPPVINPKLLEPYQPIIELIRKLYESGQALEASRLVNDFVLELPKEERSALALWLAQELQWFEKSLYISNNDILNDQLVLRFPLAHHQIIRQNAKQFHIPEALIYAIIRQESTFRDNVVSSAGALGLMQVMPKTAEMIAKKAGIQYKNRQQLFSIEDNIRLGTAYLQQLGKRFRNHPMLMAAAYNAGPYQVERWLKNHPPKQIDIWIDTLPWHETRNYLKNVIAFYAVYQYLKQEKPDLSPFMKEI